jgi:hypothetical protein
MSNVIHVKFGMDRVWPELEERIRAGIADVLGRHMPDRADRAILVAEETVARMREFDQLCGFSMTVDYEVPRGCTPEVAAQLHREMMENVQVQVSAALKKLNFEAGKAIALAATMAVTAIAAKMADE